MVTFPRHKSYKDSGLEWLGEIPSHWKLKKLKFIARIKNGQDYKNLAVDETGYPVVGSGGRFAYASKYLFNGESVLLGRKGTIDKPLYINGAFWTVDTMFYTQIHSNTFPKFFYYCALTIPFRFYSTNTAVPSMTQEDLGNHIFGHPPIEEQKRIVEFLDCKTAEIDQAIAQKQSLIELLQEQKVILINQAVTKGLNFNAPMRYGGVDWIGEIPEHWKIRRAKYLFREIDERSKTGDEELLSVSHITGVTPRSEKNVNMFLAEDYSGSKLCHKDDLVINIMWAWMGALGVSKQTGIVGPSYGVFRQLKTKIFNSWYLEHLLRSIEYIAQYNRISTGLHSSRLRLYADMFLNMEILLPPKDEQDQIEAIATEQTKEIDTAIKAIDREIEVIKELRSILISQAVTGKINVLGKLYG
jgi:type I restriction enzyme, S subunit